MNKEFGVLFFLDHSVLEMYRISSFEIWPELGQWLDLGENYYTYVIIFLQFKSSKTILT